jgi:indole-3-glycerol phosphate synthase
MPVLDEIVRATRVSVAERKRTTDLSVLRRAAEQHTPRGFRQALEQRAAADGVAVIAELKRASPSKGVLRANMDVAAIARAYEQAGAAALSVLTEEQYFKGSLENLRTASLATTLPCLRKDFIVDEFQVVEARANCADAILLIAASLSDGEMRGLQHAARELQLDVLCEVHDERELERAIACGSDVIGVNNRDLKTFHVDLATAERLASRIPDGILKVAESGIHSGEDVARLRSAGFGVFLVGESLITKASPGEALRELLRAAQAAVGAGRVKAESRA